MIPLEPRYATKQIMVGHVPVGGGTPITVQTMTKCPTEDEERVLEEIEKILEIYPKDLSDREIGILKELEWLDLAESMAPFKSAFIRISVNNKAAAEVISSIVDRSPLPVVADIHFNAKFAIAALEGGVHKLRLNPGNIRDIGLKKDIIHGCRDRNVPLRIGVNAGSIDPAMIEKHGGDPLAAMADSVMTESAICESEGFHQLAYSVKTNKADTTIKAYEKLAEMVYYPAHLGVTEAGVGTDAVINSLVGIGILLKRGIGDTIRVSLTESSALEVIIGYLILETLKLNGPDMRPVWGESIK